jgi:hypothetical protein
MRLSGRGPTEQALAGEKTGPNPQEQLRGPMTGPNPSGSAYGPASRTAGVKLRHVGTSLCQMAKRFRDTRHQCTLITPHSPRIVRHFHGFSWCSAARKVINGTVTARLSILASSALLLAALSACTNHYVTRGAELYAGGFYIEAAEVFARTEKRLEEASPTDQAQYGLYRGATLLALGDARRARRWLGYSERLLHTDAALLSGEERDMLQRALGILASQTPSATPPTPGHSGTAMVESHHR